MNTRLFIALFALFLYAAHAQTVALSVAAYKENACTNFIGSTDFYGKNDGTQCDAFQGKSIKAKCNSTHIVLSAYSDTSCNNAAGTGTIKIGECTSGLKYYCTKAPVSGNYIKSDFYTATGCAADKVGFTLNFPVDVCGVDSNGNDGVKYSCSGTNVTSVTYKNSKTCSGTGTKAVVEDKKCYTINQASVKLTCSGAASVAFYGLVSVFAFAFLIL
eukprot:gene3791-6952_t